MHKAVGMLEERTVVGHANTNTMREVRTEARHLHRELCYGPNSGRQELGPNICTESCIVPGTQGGASVAEMSTLQGGESSGQSSIRVAAIWSGLTQTQLGHRE